MDKKEVLKQLEILDYVKEHMDYDFEESKTMLKTIFKKLYEKVDVVWGEEEENQIEFIFDSICNKASTNAVVMSAELNGLDLDKLKKDSTNQS
jgi:hypothetical protein